MGGPAVSESDRNRGWLSCHLQNSLHPKASPNQGAQRTPCVLRAGAPGGASYHGRVHRRASGKTMVRSSRLSDPSTFGSSCSTCPSTSQHHERDYPGLSQCHSPSDYCSGPSIAPSAVPVRPRLHPPGNSGNALVIGSNESS